MSRFYISIIFVAASSCATTRDAGEACNAYVADEVATVFFQYERYRDHGFEPGLVGAARVSLERARQSLHGNPVLSAIPACPRRHMRQASWTDLRDDLESADAVVGELEEMRGVRFVGYSAGRVQWVDSTTGKPVPAEFAESI